MAELSDRGWAALAAVRELSDVAPAASAANDYAQPRRRAYAFQVASKMHEVGELDLDARPSRGSYASRPATSAANTMIALRRRGLVAGGAGMAFDSTWWWITPEGVQALDERSG